MVFDPQDYIYKTCYITDYKIETYTQTYTLTVLHKKIMVVINLTHPVHSNSHFVAIITLAAKRRRRGMESYCVSVCVCLSVYWHGKLVSKDTT